MAFQVSPGVNVSEIDLTGAVVAASTSIGGTVMPSRWGQQIQFRPLPLKKNYLQHSENQIQQLRLIGSQLHRF